MTRPPRWMPLLMIAILLPAGLAPTADALYSAEDPLLDELDEVEGPHSSDVTVTTGVNAVDTRVEGAQQATDERLDDAYAETDQAKAAVREANPDVPIRVYSDDVDKGEGRIGEWATLGVPTWTSREGAGRSGGVGYTSGGRGDGTYLPGESMLVSPELDLRTGLATLLRRDDPDLSFCEMLRQSPVEDDADEVETPVGTIQLCGDAELGREPGGRAKPWTYYYDNVTNGEGSDLFPDPYYYVQLDLRTNLALNREDVQLRVYEGAPPTDLLCNQGCTDLRLDVPDRADWSTGIIDLSRWAEERVWLAIYVEADQQATFSHYFQSLLFEDRGFYGVEVDNVSLWTPAVPVNIQVHELVDPSRMIPDPLRTDPVVSPQLPIPVRTVVRNTGLTDMPVEITVEIRDASGEVLSADHSRVIQVVDEPLAPGASFTVDEQFPPVGEEMDKLVATVSVKRAGVHGAADQDAPPGTDQDADADVDPADDSRAVTFDVVEFRSVQIRDFERSAPWASSGDALSVSARIENEGLQAETVKLHARVVDMEQARRVLQDSRLELESVFRDDLLPPGQNERTVLVAPTSSQEVTWDLRTDTPGQYRLFVRTEDQPALTLEDLRPPSLEEPFRAVRIEEPIDLKEFLDELEILDEPLDEPLWDDAIEYPVQLDDHGDTLGGTLRFLHDAQHLFIGVEVFDETSDTSDSGNEDLLWMAFDDLADGIMNEGEDAVLRNGEISGVTNDENEWRDLAYDPATNSWEVETPKQGAVERRHISGEGYHYVIVRPLESDVLAAGVGESIRFMMTATNGAGNNAGTYRFPAGALTEDGRLLSAPDGTIGQEVAATWQRVVLETGETGSFGDRAWSPGLGVDRSPPAIFQQDFSEGCSDEWTMAERWVASAAADGEIPVETPNWRFQRVGLIEGWNCGAFDPEGRNLVYQGLHPDSGCGEAQDRPCLPYSAFSFDRTDSGAPITDGREVPASILYSPPVHVQDVAEPTVFLEHQYGTAVLIGDEGTLNGNVPNDRMRPLNIATLGVEVWDPETRSWGEEIYLVPEGGYDTEETIGLRDPRSGPVGRGYSPNGFAPGFCQPQQSQSRMGTPNCGWWHPTNTVDGTRVSGGGGFHRPLDSDIPIAVTLPGSPWKIDRIPLHGTHPEAVDMFGNAFGDPVEVDLRGQTIRLVFTYISKTGSINSVQHPVPHEDYGWRIGSVTVAEGADQVVDLGLASMVVDPPYDAQAMGLGPGSTVPIHLNVTNAGAGDAGQSLLRVEGRDLVADATVCSQETLVEGLEAGETVPLTLGCTIDADAPDGAPIKFRAEVVPPGGVDDMMANNRLQDRTVYEVQRSPDLAIDVQIVPQTASAGFPREQFVTVRNVGNMPVEGFRITLTTQDSSLAGNFVDTIEVGQAVEIRDLTPEDDPDDNENAGPIISHMLRYTPDDEGEYLFTGRVSGVSGDRDAQNDRSAVRFFADGTIYANDLGGTPVAIAGAVDGELRFEGDAGVWQIAEGFDGPALVAGDPRTRDIPAQSDAWVRLPTIDLSAADGATLTFRHAYDLERSYDAAVVEASVDGGPWQRVPATPDAAGGLPEGYPSEILTGSSGLLDGSAQLRSAAFTGDSAQLPGASEDGVVTSSFDLAGLEALRVRRPILDLDLDGLPAHPSEELVDNEDVYFSHPAWRPAEDAGNDPEALEARWLIENRTVNDPRPHSGRTMWWSGSVGEVTEERQEQVQTVLTLPLDLQSDRGDNEQLVFSFWDWRPGWRDSDHPKLEEDSVLTGSSSQVQILRRDGKGGAFAIRVEEVLEDGSTGDARDYALPSEIRYVRGDDDGWTKREIDVTDFRDSSVRIQFTYTSTPAQRAMFEANAGWFLDDLALTSFLEGESGTRGASEVLWPPEAERDVDDLEGLGSVPCQQAGEYTMYANPSMGPLGRPSVGCWGLVSRAQPTPAGWNIAQLTDGPGGRNISAWSFTDDNDQGYPHNADARVITPAMDLAAVAGEDAFLRFNHRYDFAFEQPSDNDATAITHAWDGGVVEFQVFDEATASFSSWRPLLASPQIDPLYFTPADPTQSDVHTDQIYPAYLMAGSLEPTGYPAIYPQGMWGNLALGGGTLGNTFTPWIGSPFIGHEAHCIGCRGGGGYNFQNQRGFTDMPVAFAFSGDSNGWQPASFDVSPLLGKTVRFGFHAWTNPSHGGQDPLGGWQITDIGVEGDVFAGRPVDLRLRVVTDESLTKGQWVVDDVEVTGRFYQRNVGFSTSAETIHLQPGAPLELETGIRNLGTEGRTGLALGVTARLESSGQRVDPQIVFDGIGPVNASHVAYKGLDTVLGPFSLAPVGGDGRTEVPLEIKTVAPDGEALLLELRILEDLGKTIVHDNGSVEHIPSYQRPADQLVSNTVQDWRIVGETRPELTPVRPDDTRSGLITTDTSGFVEGGPVTVTAGFTNSGTTLADVEVEWSVYRMGDDSEGPATQVKTEVFSDTVPGSRHVPSFTFPVPEADFYTVDLRMTVEGADPVDLTLDFPVGRSTVYWSQDFSTDDGLEEWNDDGSPGWWVSLDNDATAWSTERVPGTLSWGRHPYDVVPYCDPLNCAQNGATGFRYAIESPVVDLTRVLNGQASLTLRHSADLAPNADGAHIDLARYEQGAEGWIVSNCDGLPPYPLAIPTGANGYDGATVSQGGNRPSINPFGNGFPSFVRQGSLEAPVVTEFRLDQQPLWCPGADDDEGYIGAGATFLLDVGIRGAGGGYVPPPASGWQIASAAVASTGLDIGPTTAGLQDADRLLPVERGAQKTYTITFTNTGAGDEVYDAHVVQDPFGIADAWTEVLDETVSLGAGQTGTGRFSLSVPEDTNPGRYPVRIDLVARSDAAIRTSYTILVDVQSQPRPDLAVSMKIEGDPLAGYERGKVIPVHATVFNLGAVPSGHVDLDLVLVDGSGVETVVGSAPLDPICPVSECGENAAKHTHTFDWKVPDVLGDYTLAVVADPHEAVLEVTRSNNADAILTRIIALQVPDVAVTALTIDGVGLDGFVEEGDLLKMTAHVANVGEVSARNVRVSITAGSLELTDRVIPEILPGQQITVTTTKLAAGGETVLRAVAKVPDDARIDNDESSRIIRVRTHDLSLEPIEPEAAGAVGGPVNFLVRIGNDGNSLETVKMTFTNATGWQPTMQPSPLAIAPGGEATALVTLWIPESTVAGKHEIGLEAVPVGAPLAAAASAVVVDVQERFAPPEMVLGANASLPGATSMPLQARNMANHPINLTFEAVSPDGWTEAPLEVEVLPLEETRIDLPLTVPDHTEPGQYFVAWQVTSAHWNGSLQENLTVLTDHRVEASWGNLTSHAPAGDGTRYDLPVHLDNRGNIATTVGVHPAHLPPYIEMERFDDIALGPAERKTVLLPIMARQVADTGDAEVRVMARPGMEDEELLARLQLPPLHALPNLRVLSFEVGDARAGQPIPVMVHAKNVGTGPSPPTYMALLVDGTVVHTVDVPMLQAQQSIWSNVSLYSGAPPGSYEFSVLLDASMAVVESSEHDNMASRTVVIESMALHERATQSVPGVGLIAALLAVASAALLAQRRRRGR